MLTIKVVLRDGATITSLARNVRTAINTASSGTSRPAGLELLAKESPNTSTRNPAFPDMLVYEREDGTECSVDNGTVYVMNESGKTVDVFYLHGSAESQTS
jgi:hypothetical protein